MNIPRPFPGQILGYTRKGKAVPAVAGGASAITAERAAELRALPVAERERQLIATRDELARIGKFDVPTQAQVERCELLIDELDVLERAQKLEFVRAAVANPKNRENGFGGFQALIKRDPFENIDALRHTAPDDPDVIARAVTAVSEVRSMYTEDADREAAVRMIERVPGVAHHALVHGTPAYRSGFEAYLRSGGVNPLYTSEEVDAIRASMSLTGNTGGYMLPTLLDPSLVKTGTAARNPLRSISRVVQGTQNVWHGVSVGNVTTYWVAENTALTDGSPTFASPSVTAQKLTAYVTASYEIFEDSGSLAQLPAVIAESMSFKEQTAFITGNGTTEPKGIVTCISGTAGSTVTATTRGSFTTASAVDLFAMVNAVASRYEDNTTWVANKQTFNTIKQMSTGSNGSFFWSDFNVGAAGKELLGSPTVACSDMTAATTSGSKLMILGDFSSYVIFDRIGTSVELVQNVVDGSGLPLAQRGLIAHARVGADTTDVNAFRILNC